MGEVGRLFQIGVYLVWELIVRSHRIAFFVVRDGRGSAVREIGEAIARAAERLGPVAVKLAQMASYRTDLFPSEGLEPLQRLQDHVTLPRRRVLEEVRRRVPRTVTDVLTLDRDPIGAGSVAIVFRAQSKVDGRFFAVKLLRPRVREQMGRDMRCFVWMVRLIARTPWCRGIPVSETFDHISVMVAGQCDLVKEAESLRRIRAELSGWSRVALPAVQGHLCTSDVVVMELVEDAHRLTHPDVPLERYKAGCLELLRALYFMIFQSGLVHCDFHPGNVLVDGMGRTALVDAGLVAELASEDRTRFREFFISLAEGDSVACARAIVESAAQRPSTLDRTAFERDVDEIVSLYSGRRAGRFLVAEFVYQLFQLQRRHKLYGAPGFVCAIWALVMYEGLVRDRYPDLDFQAEARPFFVGGVIEAVRQLLD